MKYQLIREDLEIEGYEKVVRFSCEETKLDSIVAIHNTRQGPALGGIRMLHYGSFEEGLQDVLRLAEGMTYKAFISGVKTGGGKSVVFLPEGDFSRESLFESFGQAVASLQGEYICAEDMGTSPEDMQFVQRATSYVVGRKNISGDPSYYTAHGLFLCLKSVARKLNASFGDSLRGLKVAIQGLGMVGFKLAEKLFWEGVSLVVADVNDKITDIAKTRFGADVVGVDEILRVSCDILSPCARGGILNSKSISVLGCKGITGAANNQLESPKIAEDLFLKGILYVPDYLANAGGLINAASELEKPYDPRKVLLSLDRIPAIFNEAYKISNTKNISLERVFLERFQEEF
ncbi:Glu/Leu/Phe/Val dehydrogenase family protein [Chlamydiifrater volucris]|uniref:Glu/Leu/Phe/Val dehydrogenase family protein n=1 Tax=Chlamydiifrater volucris TaxID=2681470 RepID=UPI001BCB7066|nr:Glu/Leu/Phe/Val dehydrogenase dimerization domain-containing protein [Chlamydiifrater volucris]